MNGTNQPTNPGTAPLRISPAVRRAGLALVRVAAREAVTPAEVTLATCTAADLHGTQGVAWSTVWMVRAYARAYPALVPPSVQRALEQCVAEGLPAPSGQKGGRP